MAISDISLASGMRSSLFSLQGISKSINRTQERLATGRKVNSALDNPTNFFAAQEHFNRAADLNGRKDGVSETIQAVRAANAGITAISSLLQAASGIATAALGTSDQTSRNALASQFDEIIAQIDTIKSDSSYRGNNLLNGQSLTVEFSETSGQSTMTIAGVDASSAGLGVTSAIDPTSVTSTTTVGSNIALGGSDPVLINADGTVTAVSNYGGVPLPAGLTGVVSVASGNGFSLALKDDGTVVGWGDNSLGQVNTSNLAGVTAIAAGSGLGTGFGLALQSDGTVVGWGDNTYGQTNTSGLTGITAISAGYGFGLALTGGGTVVGWGDNANSQLNIPGGLAGVTAIAAGNDFGLALLGNGTIVGWGDDSFSQLSGIPGASNFVAISAGVGFGLALDSNGDVFAWGDNTFNQTDVPALGNVVAISAGVFNAIAVDDTGTAVDWGFSFAPYPAMSTVKTTSSTINIPSNTWSSANGIQASVDQLNSATATLRTNTQGLASNSNILTTRLDFIATMSNTLLTGAENLTLADMNEEAANMLMLQTRQSLATTSLRLGAQSAQALLRLF